MKLVVDRNIGPEPLRTPELDAAVKATWNNTATPEQMALIEKYREDRRAYMEKVRIVTKLPCPVCGSTFTYAKGKGRILHCRKCCQDSELEFKN